MNRIIIADDCEPASSPPHIHMYMANFRICPFCGSEGADTVSSNNPLHELQVTRTSLMVSVHCKNCGKKWSEHYAMKDIRAGTSIYPVYSW